MKRHKFGPHEVLLGLDWDIPTDNRGSEGAMIRSMLRSESHRGCRFGTVVRSTDINGAATVTVGFVPPTETTRPRLPSAAALLAMASHQRRMSGSVDSGLSTTEGTSWNWLVIEKLDDDNYWLVGIMQAAPLPTSDIIGSFEQVVDIATEFLQRSENDFVVHTRDDEIRHSLSLIADSSSNQGFFELLGDADGIRVNEAIPKQIAGMRMPVFMLAVAMLVVVMGTVAFIHWRHAHQAELARQRAAAAAAAASQRDAQDRLDYQAKVEQAVQEALVKGKKTIDTALSTPSPSVTIGSWISLVQAVDLDQAGWTITGIDCQAGTTPSCHVSLSRGEMGVNRLLLAAHPDAVIEGDKASFDLHADRVANRVANWSHLDDARALMVNLLSDLQLLRNGGLEYHQETSKEIVQPVTMPTSTLQKFQPGSTSKVGPAPSVQMGVASGQMGVGGKAIWQLDGVGEFLDREGVTLQSVAIKVGADGVSDWKLNATYYLRSKPQPVLPIIMVDGKPLPVNLPKAFQEVRQASGGMSASDGQAAILDEAPASSRSAPSPIGLPPPPPPPPSSPGPITQTF